jgi:hypothetical protein
MLHSLSSLTALGSPSEFVVETTRVLEQRHGESAGMHALQRAASSPDRRERDFWLKVARCVKADRRLAAIADLDARERLGSPPIG